MFGDNGGQSLDETVGWITLTFDPSEAVKPGDRLTVIMPPPEPARPLPQQIPLKHAMGMLLTGRRVSAREGFELGFVNEVVAPEELASAAQERRDGLAQRIGQIRKRGPAVVELIELNVSEQTKAVTK